MPGAPTPPPLKQWLHEGGAGPREPQRRLEFSKSPAPPEEEWVAPPKPVQKAALARNRAAALALLVCPGEEQTEVHALEGLKDERAGRAGRGLKAERRTDDAAELAELPAAGNMASVAARRAGAAAAAAPLAVAQGEVSSGQTVAAAQGKNASKRRQQAEADASEGDRAVEQAQLQVQRATAGKRTAAGKAPAARAKRQRTG